MIAKTCYRCGDEKPIADFYRNPGTRDGLLGQCKACQKAATSNTIEAAIPNDAWRRLQEAMR